MKKVLTTEEIYRRRIELVMQYIADNLDKEIDMQTLSIISGFSSFHLHRIIKVYIGESIGAFIVRKRVETAAKLLLYSNMSVSDIAYRVGYNVPTSLTKAFAKHYGISPTQYRYNRNSIDVTSASRDNEIMLETYRVVELPSTNVIYIGSKGHYRARDYFPTYQKLFGELKRQGKVTDNITYLGIFYNNPNVTIDDNLYNEIGITTQQEIEPSGNIEVKRLPGGKYIVFTFNDRLSKLDDTYNRIYSLILANELFHIRDSYGFEKYLDDLEYIKPNSKIKIEIYIPIEYKNE